MLCITTRLSLAIWLSFYLTKLYVSHQVVTLNAIKQLSRLAFPNVTICPKHPDALNFSGIEASG